MSAIDLRCCPRDCWQMNTHHTALRHYAGQIGPSEPPLPDSRR
ncbi:hypothetical protein [Streptomyces sp. NBC_00829]|nr:hypothetical protein OG293_35655 [Streptomyces sp. NBC_00829]